MSRWDDDNWELMLGASMPKLDDEVGAPKIARQKGWMPRIDLLEAASHLLVRVELAGVPARSIHVSYQPKKNKMVIRGERFDELPPGASQRYQPLLLEIEEGSFSREILLPDVELNLQEIKSEFRNGILTIVLPKAGGETSVMVVEKVTVKKF